MLEPWIQTRSSRKFTPLNPKQEDIIIEDIAWALSMLPRYCGHTVYPYSVGYHSFLVSLVVPPQYALEGLLHDASEAYLNDIPGPVKRNFRLNGYCEIEDIVSVAIARKFHLEYPYPETVMEIDTRILANEKRDLFTVQYDWGLVDDPIEDLRIVAMDQWTVYRMFLNRVHELIKERV